MKLRLLILMTCLVVLPLGFAGAQSLSVDHVDGLDPDGYLTGDPLTVYVRVTGDASSHGGLANGFRVYSPTGHSWTSLVGDTTGTLGKAQFDGGFFINYFSANGSGADTIGFGGFRFFSTGIPAGFDDIAFTLDLGPFDGVIGYTEICLDSAFYPPSGVWKWAGPDVFPAWDGPHCWSTPPDPCEIVLTSPSGGEVYAVGTQQTLSWTTTECVCDLEVQYSVDGGPWVNLPGASGAANTYDWVVPDVPTDDFRIRVCCVGESACSDPVTVSVVSPCEIEVTSPGNGEMLTAGGAYTIAWSSTASCECPYKIEYSLNGGMDWLSIAVSVDPGVTSYEWAVPFSAAEGVVVRVCCVDESVCDLSGVFSIVDAYVPQIAVSPDSLFFFATEGDPNPAAQYFTVDEMSSEPLSFGITEAAAWITAMPDSAVNEDSITVSVDITGLTFGIYVDSIMVTAAEASNSPQYVQVILDLDKIDYIPVLVVDPDTILFEVVIGDPNPDAQWLYVNELTGVPTAFMAAEYADWLSLDKVAGVTPDSLMAMIDLAGLPVGEYFTTVDFYVDQPGKDVPDETAVVHLIISEPPCSEMVLSDTAFYFSKQGLDNPLPQTLTVDTPDEPFCFEIFNAAPSWLAIAPVEPCTGEDITLTVDGSALDPGIYTAECAVIGGDEVCEPATRYFSVVFEVKIPVSDEDVIHIATKPAVPGSRTTTPITFENTCNLESITMSLGYDSENLHLDSVSFIGSRLSGWSNIILTQEMDKLILVASISGGEEPIPAGAGQFMNLHFTIDEAAPHAFYPITTVAPSPLFGCVSGGGQLVPTVIPGYIIVGSAENYVCGYVVDPDGRPIEGATVELWPDFPYTGYDDQVFSQASGLFEFFNSMVVPFDLYAYKEGYYPGKVENLNFQQTGIMIVLAPIEPILPTPEWVNFYCEANTYLDAELPVGSVIDAYDDDGVHCGSYWVSEAGRYGFMPVYRDDPYTDIDEGADPGDVIRFYVNGLDAYTEDPTIWTENGDALHVCFDVGNFITQTCDLMEGWNLVSWRVDSESDDIEEVLASIADYLIVVLGFEGGGLTYDPELPYHSTLNYVDHLSGYWIKVSRNCTLEITGAAIPVNTPIAVNDGWNLVSYLPENALPTEVALESIHSDLIVALGFDDGGLVYQPDDELHNTLLEMATCNGYWTKVDRNTQLVYPGAGPVTSPQLNPDLFAAFKSVESYSPTNTWMNLWADELTLDGEPVAAGATVTARLADGTVIGGFTLDRDGLFGFMPVYGDDQTTATADGATEGGKFYLNVNGVETNEEFTWSGHGEKFEVAALTSSTTEDANLPGSFQLNQNYPNPFNPSTTISFALPTAAQAKVEVYNILGRLVAVPFDGMAQSGNNEVTWNGENSTGQAVASGVYFYRLTTKDFTETKKMMLLK